MEISLGQRLRELSGPVLLTGHTGFKGAWMTFLLEHLGVPVIGYSLPAEKYSLYDRAERIGVIPELFSDIRDQKALEYFVDLHKPSTIVHMAAQPLVIDSYESPRETFDVNVMGTVNLLDIASKKDFVKAIIVVTTDKVYRNDDSDHAFTESDPLEGRDPYSASKVGAEAAVAAWRQISKISGGPKIVAVRAGNVIGGGDWANNRLLPDIVRAKYFSQKVIIRNPKSTRPWQHVLDPLNGYLKALEFMIADNIDLNGFNFGPEGKSLQVHEVIKLSFPEDFSEDNLIEINSTNLIHEAHTLNLDSNFARSKLGFIPKFTQQEAILMTMKWWEKVINGEDIYSACNYDIMKNLEK